jgi:predicted MPP superfamily phosphohydrolase
VGTRRFPRLTRRRFLLSAGVGVYTWRVDPHWVEVVLRPLPVRGLPAALEGRTLAQVSDLHVGPQVDSGYLVAALRQVSALEPDIVAVTGDFMSLGGPDRVDEVARVLEHLTPPPLGCFAVLGNHDYGEAWSHPEVAAGLAARLTGLGIQLLRNDSRVVEGLRVVGVDDLWGTNFRPAEVLPGLAPDAPAVVLCHNPDAADWPVWGGYRGGFCPGTPTGANASPRFSPRHCSLS